MKTHASFDGRRKTSPQMWWTSCAEIVIWFNLMILYLPIICILICHYICAFFFGHYLPIWSYLILFDPIWSYLQSLNIFEYLWGFLTRHICRDDPCQLPRVRQMRHSKFSNRSFPVQPGTADTSRYQEIIRNHEARLSLLSLWVWKLFETIWTL